MTIFKEIDIVRILAPVEAYVSGNGKPFIVTVREGAIGTVMLVHGSTASPAAYEIEFEPKDAGLKDSSLILLAAVPAHLVAPA